MNIIIPWVFPVIYVVRRRIIRTHARLTVGQIIFKSVRTPSFNFEFPSVICITIE